MKATIAGYMTPQVHTIAANRTLADAHRVMNDHRIRHLPVLAGGQLVGLVSQGDLHLIESLRDVDPDTVTVAEAMSQEVVAAAPEAPLAEVAEMMSERRLGCIVVMRGNVVLGIFTAVDGLRVLSVAMRSLFPAGRIPRMSR
jgi:acetoin utilization protein AcuB